MQALLGQQGGRAPLRLVDEVEVLAVLERVPAAVRGDEGLVDAGQEHGRAAATPHGVARVVGRVEAERLDVALELGDELALAQRLGGPWLGQKEAGLGLLRGFAQEVLVVLDGLPWAQVVVARGEAHFDGVKGRL